MSKYNWKNDHRNRGAEGEKTGWTPEMVGRMLTNPAYCLSKVAPFFAEEHPTMVSEEEFIQAGVKLIAEHGAEWYIRQILENLKGNYVSAQEGHESDATP